MISKDCFNRKYASIKFFDEQLMEFFIDFWDDTGKTKLFLLSNFFLSNLHFNIKKSIKLGLFDVFFIKWRNLIGKLHHALLKICHNLDADKYRIAAEDNRFSKKNGNKDANKLGKENTRTQTQIAQSNTTILVLKNKIFISQHSDRSEIKHVRHDWMVERI